MTNLTHAQVTEAGFTRSVRLPSSASHRRPKARRALCQARGHYYKRAFPSHRQQGLFSPAPSAPKPARAEHLLTRTQPRRRHAHRGAGARPAPPPPALSGLRPSLAPRQAAGSRSRSQIPEPAVPLLGHKPRPPRWTHSRRESRPTNQLTCPANQRLR